MKSQVLLSGRLRLCLTTLGSTAAVCLVALLPGGLISRADAHCVPADKLDTLSIENDQFKNFDFNAQDVDRCKVDWPLNFLFWNDAAVGKVKNKMGQVGYNNSGDTMYGRLYDGGAAGWEWDVDQGRKNGGCLGDVEHFRVYGAVPDDQRMYNPSWGYYVLASSHIDHNECFTGTWHGASELAEGRIANDARNVDGFGNVEKDALNFYNHLDLEVANDGHHLHNSGDATTVKVN